MTEKEIFEYNRRCALFLGWKETTKEFKINWVGCKTEERLDRMDKEYIPILEKDDHLIFPDFSTFNCVDDWNWIMQVVEAIEDIKYKTSGETIYNFDIYGNVCKISTVNEEVLWVKDNSKKKAVVQAINQFLTWYNNENA